MNKEHLHPDGRPYTKEEFVEKIKTDKEFSKRFGNLGKIYASHPCLPKDLCSFRTLFLYEEKNYIMFSVY